MIINGKSNILPASKESLKESEIASNSTYKTPYLGSGASQISSESAREIQELDVESHSRPSKSLNQEISPRTLTVEHTFPHSDLPMELSESFLQSHALALQLEETQNNKGSRQKASHLASYHKQLVKLTGQ